MSRFQRRVGLFPASPLALLSASLRWMRFRSQYWILHAVNALFAVGGTSSKHHHGEARKSKPAMIIRRQHSDIAAEGLVAKLCLAADRLEQFGRDIQWHVANQAGEADAPEPCDIQDTALRRSTV
jgi:hypothetical protein